MNTKKVVNEIQGGKVLTSTLMKYSGQIFERRLTGCEKSTERFFILLSSQKKKWENYQNQGIISIVIFQIGQQLLLCFLVVLNVDNNM